MYGREVKGKPTIATDRAMRPQFRYKYWNRSATASRDAKYFYGITVETGMDGIVHTNLKLTN